MSKEFLIVDPLEQVLKDAEADKRPPGGPEAHSQDEEAAFERAEHRHTPFEAAEHKMAEHVHEHLHPENAEKTED